MKERAFVVADAHGNWDAVQGLLRQEGLWDDAGPTKLGFSTRMIQLGDLMNCVKDSYFQDIETIENASNVFDIFLPGNHEHPYWPGYITKFWGFYYYPPIEKLIEGLVDDGSYHAAVAHGNVLITHAGLCRGHEGSWQTADEAATYLNEAWEKDPSDAIFNEIGYARGGRVPYGGILWSDWQEAKCRDFSQVVGHTPGKLIRTRDHESTKTQAVCIDLGANVGRRIAGAWIDADGTITPVIHDPDNTGDDAIASTGENVDLF